ncbi:MAG: hypothetical protein R3359_03665 [Marinirhabdus sp.]|nr:hypothetical protein [Marinirhabdus sp.]
MDSCCIASVIFEGNLPFLPKFLASLQEQTDPDFTLLLFNDGVENLQAHLTSYTLPFKIIETKGTIAEVRTQLLSYVSNSEFDFTVFGDTDDYFATNRIALSKKLLEQHAIVAHDVWLVNELGQLLEPNYWKYRREVVQGISYDHLKHYNVLGLGNTAVQNKILPKNFSIPADLIAVDWYVFSNILKVGVHAFFTAETYVYYRQYEGNTIGLKQLTLQRFQREVSVKRQHYLAMARVDTQFEPLAASFGQLHKKISDLSEEEINTYIQQQDHPFWWEQVQL